MPPRRLFDLVVIAAAIAVRTIVPSQQWIERHYSNGVYPAIDAGVRAVTGRLPFTLGDVLLVLALASIARYWFRALRDARYSRIVRMARVVLRTVTVASALYVWFMASWAYGYLRVPLAEKIAVHNARTDEDSVAAFADRVVDKLSTLAVAAHREPDDGETFAQRLVPSFTATIGRLGDRSAFSPPRVKPTLWQPMFALSGTTGFTDPWTHEVNLDATVLSYERPAIYAHEWAHIAGFNDESEANFIAVIACTTARDPRLRYSGWLLVWFNLPSDVRITHRMGKLAYADIAAIRARYLANVNRAVERASRAAYDGYLKSNHVKAGFASYRLFIRWMTGADFDRAGLPLVRG